MTLLPARIENLEHRTLLSFAPVHFGVVGYQSGTETAFDPHGNVIVAGLFHTTVVLDPGSGVKKLKARGETEIFIAKFPASGALIWAGQIGGGAGEQLKHFPQFPIDPRRAGSFVNRVGTQPNDLGEYGNGIAVD